MDIVPFVSSEQYPISVYKFTVLNISLQPVNSKDPLTKRPSGGSFCQNYFTGFTYFICSTGL